MTRAVLYLRYSSERQTEQSIEGQRRVCTEYANSHDITIVGEYIDRAASASKNAEKRHEFNRMLSDAVHHNWEMVLVYKMDRFARDVYADAVNKKLLRDEGVKVVSATESIPDDPMGVIIESLIAGMNEYYSVELRQKVLRGMRESALKCNSTGGTIPYGYKIENKKYVINEDEAKLVRETFERYALGEQMSTIISSFTKRGYLGRNGKPLSLNTFNDALKNKKYIGCYKYGDIVIADGMPRIIDDATFYKVQRIMEERNGNRIGTGKKIDRGLGGKVYCGECGNKMNAVSGKSKSGKRFYYYVCEHKCVPSVNRVKLEDAIYKQLLEELTDAKIEQLADDIARERNSTSKDQEKLAKLLEELNRLKRMEKGTERFLYLPNGDIDDIMADKLAEIREDISTTSKEIEEFRSVFRLIEKGDIVSFLRECVSGDHEDKNFRQRLFDKLVSRVYIFSDRIVYSTRYDEIEDGIPPLHVVRGVPFGILNDHQSSWRGNTIREHLVIWMLPREELLS